MYIPRPPRIETARLILRPLTQEDAPRYFSYLFGSPQVARSMLWEPHKTLEESEKSIQKALDRYDAGQSCRWGIVLAEEGLIGIVELLGFDSGAKKCSFAYMLGQPYWGRGYGTEALTAALNYGFQTLGLEAVTADHFADNPASGAVMAKAGMVYTGTIPGKYEKQGRRIDALEYTLTRQMWKSMVRE